MIDGAFRAEEGLLVRPLGDVTLIYHRRSGQTHMVVSPVPEILTVFAAAGERLSVDTLVDRLADGFDLGDRAEARAAVAIHLDEMTALGLVHRG